MKGCKSYGYKIIRNTKAASPAISMVVITAATVVLVLVAGTFAVQFLDRQQGSSEFDTLQKSLVTFDDAIRDISWDRGGSRSVRFTVNYGYVALLPNEKNIQITVDEYPEFNYNISTGVVKYSIPTSYVSYGKGYKSYILGDEKTVISSPSESYSQLMASQHSNSLDYTLSYRVRVMEEGPSTIANYVDIIVIRLDCANSTLMGDFDLVARNLGVATDSTQFAAGGNTATVNVTLDDMVSESVTVTLKQELPVVFNLIMAEVSVST